MRIADIAASVAKGGVYTLHGANFGAGLSRLELYVALNGEKSQAHLSGASVLDGTAHADVTTHIVHAVGDTQSTQLFKHVADDRSRAVYQGRITVAEGANGSDSRQTAKALLLSERAEATSSRSSRSSPTTSNARMARRWAISIRIAVLSARPRHSRKRGADPS